MSKQKMKELEQMMVVLAKRIQKLDEKVNGGLKVQSDQTYLDKLKDDIKRLRLD